MTNIEIEVFSYESSYNLGVSISMSQDEVFIYIQFSKRDLGLEHHKNKSISRSGASGVSIRNNWDYWG